MKNEKHSRFPRWLRRLLWGVFLLIGMIVACVMSHEVEDEKYKSVRMGTLSCKFPVEYSVLMAKTGKLVVVDVVWPDLRPTVRGEVSPDRIPMAISPSEGVEFMDANWDARFPANASYEDISVRPLGKNEDSFDVYEMVLNRNQRKTLLSYVKRDDAGRWFRLSETIESRDIVRGFRQINNSMELEYVLFRHFEEGFDYVDRKLRGFIAKHCVDDG